LLRVALLQFLLQDLFHVFYRRRVPRHGILRSKV
jgi:hypothetical protein